MRKEMLKTTIMIISVLWGGLVSAQPDDLIVKQPKIVLDLNLYSDANYGISYASNGKPNLQLAANDIGSSSVKPNKSDRPKEIFSEKMFTANKIHKYLGIGSITAAFLTMFAPKGDVIHERLAETSAALAVGAVATGLGFHLEDIDYDKGLKDPDNMHAFTAGLGAVGIVLATLQGPDVPHGTFGSVGAIAMIYGVKYTW